MNQRLNEPAILTHSPICHWRDGTSCGFTLPLGGSGGTSGEGLSSERYSFGEFIVAAPPRAIARRSRWSVKFSAIARSLREDWYQAMTSGEKLKKHLIVTIVKRVKIAGRSHLMFARTVATSRLAED